MYNFLYVEGHTVQLVDSLSIYKEDRHVALLARYVAGGSFGVFQNEHTDPHGTKYNEFLDSLECSGDAFLVLREAEDVELVFARWNQSDNMKRQWPQCGFMEP